MTRHIKLNLVHNQSLLKQKCLIHSPTVILEDKLPYQPVIETTHKPWQIAMICSWSKDEPIIEMIDALKIMPEFSFFMTGSFKKFKSQAIKLPDNLNLTGYLSDKEYDELLKKMDIILVLTTRPETVLCGAYEAVSLCKPIITSDTEILRAHFYKGVIFTQNNAQAIKQAIKNAVPNIKKLQLEISDLRKEKEAMWQKQIAKVQNIIEK
jgi:glycosyltransferase involved in cell wall biosynthesis